MANRRPPHRRSLTASIHLLLLYLPLALPLHAAPESTASSAPVSRVLGRESYRGTTGVPLASSSSSSIPSSRTVPVPSSRIFPVPSSRIVPVPLQPPPPSSHLRPPPRRRLHRSNGGPPPPDVPIWGAHPPPEPPLHPLPHLQLPPYPPQASLSPPSPVVASSSSPSVARSPMNKPRQMPKALPPPPPPPPPAPGPAPPPPAAAAPNVSAPSLVSEGGGEGEFVGWGGSGGREMSFGRPVAGPELRVGSRSRRQDVYIAGFFPFGPRGPGGGSLGRGVMPAVKLAVDHINDSPDVLRGYRLHVYWNDTQCNAAVGVKAFFDMMHEGPRKVMLFGAACTHVTDPIAKASKHWRLTQEFRRESVRTHVSTSTPLSMFTNDLLVSLSVCASITYSKETA
ncbi:formin-like protein 5 [Ischnura elegans]|uniref:formin-like protein 5 n=1 Tax=Ischnura elegans TaxID=197161 RepID=UPI001ED88B43|nr:formin-like protein 5 [Ischnura elegans]